MKKSKKRHPLAIHGMHHVSLRVREMVNRSRFSATSLAFYRRRRIRPLDLFNHVTRKPLPVRVTFFHGPEGELIELLEDKTGYNLASGNLVGNDIGYGTPLPTTSRPAAYVAYYRVRGSRMSIIALDSGK